MALIHVMHCREIATLIDSGEVERLNSVDRIQVRVHLWVCWHCRLLVRQIRWLRSIAQRAVRQTIPAEDELEARILRRLL